MRKLFIQQFMNASVLYFKTIFIRNHISVKLTRTTYTKHNQQLIYRNNNVYQN